MIGRCDAVNPVSASTNPNFSIMQSSIRLLQTLCVVLLLTPWLGEDAIAVQDTKFVVVIVGGFDSDPTPAQIAGKSPRNVGNSGMFQLMSDLKKSKIECQFFNWNGTAAGQIAQKKPPGAEAIASWIRERASKEPHTKFVIIGHSWGGHTVMEAAVRFNEDDSISIPLTILLDASSAMRGAPPTELPAKIETVANYYTANLFCWGELKIGERIDNIFLGDPKRNFMSNGHPKYQSKFDINAHNAAEWDHRIHADIIQRTLKATKTKTTQEH